LGVGVRLTIVVPGRCVGVLHCGEELLRHPVYEVDKAANVFLAYGDITLLVRVAAALSDRGSPNEL
jgi:hypothetical protein